MSFSLPFSEPLEEAILAADAAVAASKAVIDVYSRNFTVDTKDDNSPITQADLQSNSIIKEMLASSIPVLSEEDADDKARLRHDTVWIIDPLDGTSDFVNRTGEFTIMIGLVRDNRPIVGVISRPTTGSLFLAQKGRGAFKLEGGRWERIGVSNISKLAACRAVGSRFHLSEKEKAFLRELGVFSFESRGSSLKVAEISMGAADLYLTTSDKIKHWDTCASHCLITEAGGRITDMSGNEVLYNTDAVNHQNGLLVSNGLVHDEVVRRYSDYVL